MRHSHESCEEGVWRAVSSSRMGARAEDRYGLVIVLVILSYGIAAAYGGQ